MTSLLNRANDKLESQIEKFGKVLLVIVPHSDDEVLLAGGLIQQALKHGVHVYVCIVTNGDYLAKDYQKGQSRLKESMLACQWLGLPLENFSYFGFADTGFNRNEAFLSCLFKGKKSELICGHPSCKTYGIANPPPYKEGLPYTKSAFESCLNDYLEKIHPNSIVTTSIADVHGDHYGLAMFIRTWLSKQTVAPKLFESITHSYSGDEQWPNVESSHFDQPKGVSKAQWNQRCRLVFDNEVVQKKQSALALYKTAFINQPPAVVNYLNAFVKEEEIFFEIKL